MTILDAVFFVAVGAVLGAAGLFVREQPLKFIVLSSILDALYWWGRSQ